MIAPTTNARLAAAVATVIRDHEALDAARTAALVAGLPGSAGCLVNAIEAFNHSFAALKTTFEQEFPND